MKPHWRAPACCLGAALLCALYLWMVPGVAVAEIAVGTGLGAAAMWTLVEWEARHPRPAPKPWPKAVRVPAVKGREDGAPAGPRRPMRILGTRRLRPARGAAFPTAPGKAEADAPVPVTPPAVAAARTPVPAAAKSDRTPPRRPEPERRVAAEPGETPIQAWRREVRARNIARITENLRQLAAQRFEEPPFGTPSRPRLRPKAGGERAKPRAPRDAARREAADTVREGAGRPHSSSE